MKFEIEVPNYKRETGVVTNWVADAAITTEIQDYKDGQNIVIKANREGLITLACFFLTLAQSEVPSGTHIHLDSYNGLEDESVELIISKTE